MRDLERFLKNREINYNNLLAYGFEEKENEYIFSCKIFNNQFEVIVNFSDNKKISKLIDLENKEEYVLVDVEESSGEFVGKVKKEYEDKLQDIINKCTTYSIFKNNQSKTVIEYIKQKYNDELEFL